MLPKKRNGLKRWLKNCEDKNGCLNCRKNIAKGAEKSGPGTKNFFSTQPIKQVLAPAGTLYTTAKSAHQNNATKKRLQNTKKNIPKNWNNGPEQ